MATTLSVFLWFNEGAEEAFDLYRRTFDDAEVVSVTRAVADGRDQLFVGTLRIGGGLVALFNGEPYGRFAFSLATSLCVTCDTQDQIDRYWAALSDGGEPGQCGWITDRFGVTWQIVPRLFEELMSDPDPERRDRVYRAMRAMTKFETAELLAAYDGPG